MRLSEGQMLAALSANKESREQRVPRFSGRMLSSPDLFLHDIEGAFFDDRLVAILHYNPLIRHLLTDGAELEVVVLLL